HTVRLPMLFFPRCHMRQCAVFTWCYNSSESIINKCAGSHVLFTTLLLSIFKKQNERFPRTPDNYAYSFTAILLNIVFDYDKNLHHLRKGCFRMSTREKIKRGNDLRVTTRRTNRDKINAKMHTLLAAASAPRQDKRENTRFAWHGGRTATRETRKYTLYLARRTHRDKINTKMHTLLATASAPRQDKRENTHFAWHGGRTATR